MKLRMTTKKWSVLLLMLTLGLNLPSIQSVLLGEAELEQGSTNLSAVSPEAKTQSSDKWYDGDAWENGKRNPLRLELDSSGEDENFEWQADVYFVEEDIGTGTANSLEGLLGSTSSKSGKKKKIEVEVSLEGGNTIEGCDNCKVTHSETIGLDPANFSNLAALDRAIQKEMEKVHEKVAKKKKDAKEEAEEKRLAQEAIDKCKKAYKEDKEGKKVLRKISGWEQLECHSEKIAELDDEEAYKYYRKNIRSLMARIAQDGTRYEWARALEIADEFLGEYDQIDASFLGIKDYRVYKTRTESMAMSFEDQRQQLRYIRDPQTRRMMERDLEENYRMQISQLSLGAKQHFDTRKAQFAHATWADPDSGLDVGFEEMQFWHEAIRQDMREAQYRPSEITQTAAYSGRYGDTRNSRIFDIDRNDVPRSVDRRFNGRGRGRFDYNDSVFRSFDRPDRFRSRAPTVSI